MKESYSEGLAIHTGPESCGRDRKVMDEALTGVHAGWVLSCETPSHPSRVVPMGCRPLRSKGKATLGMPLSEAFTDPAQSETPSMHGSTLRGNREILRMPGPRGGPGRIGKSKDERR